MVTVTQIQILLDTAVFLFPAVGGALTGRWQPATGEEPSGRLRRAAWGCVAVIVLFTLFHIAMLGQLLPRVPLASLYLPTGFVLGYSSYRILINGQRPVTEEGRLLAGLAITGGFVLGLWSAIRTLVTALL